MPISTQVEEVFRPWARAQRVVDRLAREAPPAPWALRAEGRLAPEAAERVADWFTGPPTAPREAVHAAYRALERETAWLFAVVRGLGVRVHHVHADDDPYDNAAQLCAHLRHERTLLLRTIACDAPHPLLGGAQGGVVDQLRAVHDVLGHAALGLGFDVQAEFATWLQCRTLFSEQARGAAFCELVGAVTTYVATGVKPALRADLPPAALVAATASPVTGRRTGDRTRHRHGRDAAAAPAASRP
jgi:hypothetical protein